MPACRCMDGWVNESTRKYFLFILTQFYYSSLLLIFYRTSNIFLFCITHKANDQVVYTSIKSFSGYY